MTRSAIAAILLLIAAPVARGQGPALPDAPDPARPGGASRLGQSPGEGGGAGSGGMGLTGPDDGLLGGRVGFGTPRVPSSITRTGPGVGVEAIRGGIGPAESRSAAAPLFGDLALPGPGQPDDEGPTDGLTLDRAIETMVRGNLDLRARAMEIPQARADTITAGLRANPILYADGQLLPYQKFTDSRPGGQTQYDVNVTHPFDVSGKRRARVDVAVRVEKVLEAQYQDSVRTEIENLGTLFVDVLAAVETLRFARAAVGGAEQILEQTRQFRQRGLVGEDEVDRVTLQADTAELGLSNAEEADRKARRALALHLGLGPGAAAANLRVRGSIRDTAPPPPPAPELVRLALANRPDLCAYRLGIGRADADVRLAHAERISDVYLLYQPYTFQDNAPIHLKSSHSWGLGLSVPLPIYNRNQGNIARAKVNAAQSRVELLALEQRIGTEVEQAAGEYAVSRAAVERIEGRTLPAAGRLHDEAAKLFARGGSEVVAYLNARRDLNEIVRQYRDALVRHRRSMLALNAAVGLRLLP